MKTTILKISVIIISVFFFGLLTAIPASAQTGSPYITPTDTGVNFDYMVVPGGIVWFGGMLFYIIGKYLTVKFAAINH